MALFKSIWDDLRYSLRAGSMVTKLMVINFSVFVIVSLVYLSLWIAFGLNSMEAHQYLDKGLNWFCMPGSGYQLLKQPWSIITSLFLHEWWFHILGNVIALYLFGAIVGDLIGDRRVLPLYLLSGIVGNLLFLSAAQLFPAIIGNDYENAFALGASGAIMGLGGAALIVAPEYRVMLFLLGEVKVKYIVLVMLLLDLVSISNNINTGGHAAHLGGFAFGCVFVIQLRAGRDMAVPLNRLFDRIMGWLTPGQKTQPRLARKPHMVVKGNSGAGKGNSGSPDQLSFQEKLDLILDKIKAQGYQNLTPEEKEFLHNASKR